MSLLLNGVNVSDQAVLSKVRCEVPRLRSPMLLGKVLLHPLHTIRAETETWCNVLPGEET